jgi:hypothetical protein
MFSKIVSDICLRQIKKKEGTLIMKKVYLLMTLLVLVVLVLSACVPIPADESTYSQERNNTTEEESATSKTLEIGHMVYILISQDISAEANLKTEMIAMDQWRSINPDKVIVDYEFIGGDQVTYTRGTYHMGISFIWEEKE